MVLDTINTISASCSNSSTTWTCYNSSISIHELKGTNISSNYSDYLAIGGHLAFLEMLKPVGSYPFLINFLIYLWSNVRTLVWTVLNISKWKINRNRTATEPQPFYNILLFLRTLFIVWSPVRRRVTRRLTRLQTMYNFLNIAKHGATTTNFQFTWTGAQPHRNLKLIQFDYAQYCIR